MKIVPFVPEHLKTFSPGKFDAELIEHLDPDAWEGNALSAVKDRKTLGMAGMRVEGKTGYGWLLGSDELRRHPMLLHRAVKRGLEWMVVNYSLKRLVVYVSEDFTESRKWVERLGFREAGKKDKIMKYMRTI